LRGSFEKKSKQTFFHKFNQQMEATDVNEDISFLAFIYKKRSVYVLEKVIPLAL